MGAEIKLEFWLDRVTPRRFITTDTTFQPFFMGRTVKKLEDELNVYRPLPDQRFFTDDKDIKVALRDGLFRSLLVVSDTFGKDAFLQALEKRVQAFGSSEFELVLLQGKGGGIFYYSHGVLYVPISHMKRNAGLEYLARVCSINGLSVAVFVADYPDHYDCLPDSVHTLVMKDFVMPKHIPKGCKRLLFRLNPTFEGMIGVSKMRGLSGLKAQGLSPGMLSVYGACLEVMEFPLLSQDLKQAKSLFPNVKVFFTKAYYKIVVYRRKISFNLKKLQKASETNDGVGLAQPPEPLPPIVHVEHAAMRGNDFGMTSYHYNIFPHGFDPVASASKMEKLSDVALPAPFLKRQAFDLAPYDPTISVVVKVGSHADGDLVHVLGCEIVRDIVIVDSHNILPGSEVLKVIMKKRVVFGINGFCVVYRSPTKSLVYDKGVTYDRNECVPR